MKGSVEYLNQRQLGTIPNPDSYKLHGLGKM